MLLLSAGFMAKFELVFVLTLENAFSQTFHFKANKKSTILLENDTRDIQSSPPFKRSACFYETTSENFERFQYFETNFLKNENLFSKNCSTSFQLKILRLKTHHFHIDRSNSCRNDCVIFYRQKCKQTLLHRLESLISFD